MEEFCGAQSPTALVPQSLEEGAELVLQALPVALRGHENVAESVHTLPKEGGIIHPEISVIIGMMNAGQVMIHSPASGYYGIHQPPLDHVPEDAPASRGHQGCWEGEESSALLGSDHILQDAEATGELYGREATCFAHLAQQVAAAHLPFKDVVLHLVLQADTHGAG